MLSIRTTILVLAVPALLAIACSDSAVTGGGGSGGSGTGGVGAPGAGGAGGGPQGGSVGAGGTGNGAAGGSTGTGGVAAGGVGGTAGPSPFPIPDGGLPNLDAGIPGLIDAGLLAVCPSAPAGKTCGGQGNPLACVIENSQPLQGCVCIVQQWVCPDGSTPGQPGLDAGLPIGQPPSVCPANAQGMTCPMAGALCTTGAMGGCICLPGAGGAVTWLCR